MDSADYQKKKSAKTLLMQKNFSNTSETQVGQTSIDSISQDSDSVNTKDKKILRSDRPAESVSNRSLLANALEGATQNDIERKKLEEYKGKIALIESEQAKLSEIRARIKELSFAKGKRDTDAIRSLQFEETQTANRINTYDKQLLNLESTTALIPPLLYTWRHNNSFLLLICRELLRKLNLICTPKVKHFWRCVLLYSPKSKKCVIIDSENKKTKKNEPSSIPSSFANNLIFNFD